jgi:exopolysaccharide biosynthesis polyprenyl glycosylphosphotransferase
MPGPSSSPTSIAYIPADIDHPDQPEGTRSSRSSKTTEGSGAAPNQPVRHGVPPDGRSRRYGVPASLSTGTGLVLTLDAVALACSLVITRSFGILGVSYAVVSVALLALMNTHRPRLDLRLANHSTRVTEALVLSFGAIALTTFSAKTLEVLIRPAVTAVILIPAGRGFAYAVTRRLRKAGILGERALIIGAGKVGTEIAEALRQHPEYGIIPVGFLDAAGTAHSSRPVFDAADPESAIRRLSVTRIIVAFGHISDEELVDVLRRCADLPLKVHIVPRLFELGVTNLGSDVDNIWGFPFVSLKHAAHLSFARRAKRLFDLTVGALLLLLSTPVLAVAAVAIRLSSPGPVLFRQKRLGENGRIIEMLKLRTLRCNDDSDTTWFVGQDDRRTPVGRVLRKTSLDELPQLLNVLRGDMSLVGPRPERPYFADSFALDVPRYRDRLRVPQGLTGWAQVHGLRGDTSISDRIRFDNQYIEHWTFWSDIRILARTVAAVFGKGGA